MEADDIAAIVLSAGLSRRMGSPKLILPWGQTTVIGQVVNILAEAGLSEILVVTGGARHQVEAALRETPARAVFNPRFEQDEMILSLQVGISHLPERIQATLVTLGDQPQIKSEIVLAIVHAYHQTKAPLVIPSYRMRRGHPWLVARQLWPKILSFQPPCTLRDVLNNFSEQIHYLVVHDDSILRDLDTPSDYAREHPGS